MLASLRRNRIFAAFIQMSGAGLIVQFVAFLLTPILSRLYTPLDFSLFGTLCSIASLFSIIAAFRFEYAFFIKKENLQYFFLLSLIFIFISTSLASVILPHFFNYSSFILFIALFGISIYNIMTQFSVAKLMYKDLSISRVTQGLTQYILALIFGIILLPKGLIYSFIAGQLIASVFLYFRLNINLKVSLNKLFAILKENFIYGVNSTFTSALQWSTPLAPMLAGNFIFPSHTLGVYFLIVQSISAVTSIPRRSLINICTSELNTPDKFRDYFVPFLRKVFLNKFFILGLLMMGLVLIIVHFCGKEIISLVFGQNWEEGGSYISVLILFSIVELFVYPFVHLLNLWGKYLLTICIEVPRFICVFFILPLIANYYLLDFSTYIFGHLFCMLIFNLLILVCLIKVSR